MAKHSYPVRPPWPNIFIMFGPSGRRFPFRLAPPAERKFIKGIFGIQNFLWVYLVNLWVHISAPMSKTVLGELTFKLTSTYKVTLEPLRGPKNPIGLPKKFYLLKAYML